MPYTAITDDSGQNVLDIDSLGSVSVRSGSGNDAFDVTMSLDTNAYADGDLLADTQLVSASAFPANGSTVVVNQVQVFDLDDNKGALDVVLLRSNTSMGTENSAPNISDANATEILGVYSIYATDYKDIGGSSIAGIDINRLIKAASASTSLYVALISRDTKTYSAAGLKVRISLVERSA